MPFSIRILAAAVAAFALQGCLAKAAWDVATLPVKAAGAVVDGVTTSQSEADEKRGRELRQMEERLGKLERELYKSDEKCRKGEEKKCAERDAIAAEMREISRRLPAVPED